MAFVRAVGGGLDVDGDGVHDTGLGRIVYAGHSLGGIYGTLFLAVEPRVRVGVLAVPGGPVTEIARLSPVFRPLLRDALARRSPPLLNLAGAFQEDLPLRGDGPVVAPVPGALAIQEFVANAEWLGRRADPVAYARHLRQAPLPGLEPARVLVQWALGDRVVPNPTTAALVRAGELADRAVVVRADRVVRALGAEWPDAHGFLLSVRAPGLVGRVAMAAQEQLARFLLDDGESIWMPGEPSPLGASSALFESGAASR
jgi:pimeloyl-ACP methyl ester carboxylesterase